MLRGTFTCEGVQVLSHELTLAEAEAYCRYAVRERQKVDGLWVLRGTRKRVALEPSGVTVE
jgi:hypothetical protein